MNAFVRKSLCAPVMVVVYIFVFSHPRKYHRRRPKQQQEQRRRRQLFANMRQLSRIGYQALELV